MKICILGDLHFGARNSNLIVQNWQEKFFMDFFWPKMDELGIETIVQMGDYFDNRKWINVQTMAFQKRVFVDQVHARNIDVHGIIGNHDIPLRHSLANSSPVQILNHEDNIQFYDEPTVVDFADRKFMMMPWVCKENYELCETLIKDGGDVLIGHFDIEGFLMHAGHTSKEGFGLNDFNNWKEVYSGHYHTPSEKGNVKYVGTPYEMMWADEKCKHGFWIYDTDDSSMTYHENPYTYFHRIVWEDGTDYDPTKVTNGYVKVQVKKKTDFESFEKYVDQINFNNPYEMKIIESFEEYNSDNVGEMIELADTSDLIAEYIDDVATDNNKEQITRLMLSIYEEAKSIDDHI